MKDNANKPTKVRTVEQISAGGVVFRQIDSSFQIAIISVNPSGRWQLPKGLIDAGESAETAALREVREEAGIETEILTKIETIEYWYFGEQRGERVRFHKSVHFYLLEFRAGSVENHDDEVIEARWFEANEAIETLAFKSEKAVVEKALPLMAEILKR